MKYTIGFVFLFLMLLGRGGFSTFVGSEAAPLLRCVTFFFLYLISINLKYSPRTDRKLFLEKKKPDTVSRNLTILLLLISLSTAWSFEFKSQIFFEALAIVFVFMFWLNISKYDLGLSIKVVCLGFAGFSMFILVFGFAFSDFGQRLMVLGSGPNVLGRNLGAGICIFFSWYLASNSLIRYFYLILMVTLIPFLLATQSRGAILATFLACSYILLAGFNRRKISLAFISQVVGLTVLVATSLLTISALIQFNYRSVIFERLYSLTLVNRYYSGRDRIAVEALELWKTSPFFGVGLGTFQETFYFFGYEHNLFLIILVSTGLLGSAIFVYSILSIGNRIFKAPIKSKELILTSALAILFFTSSFFSGDLFDARFFFMSIAMLITVFPAPVNKRPNSDKVVGN